MGFRYSFSRSIAVRPALCVVLLVLLPLRASAQVTPTVVTDFSGTSSMRPDYYSGVTKDADGALYGVTLDSLNTRCGTVYKVLPDGTTTVLHEFGGFAANPKDGCQPYGELVDGGDGYLYGTTAYGGQYSDATFQYGNGTVFRVSKQGDQFGYALLHEFAAYDASLSYWPEGSLPWGGLTIGQDGNFYGTTSWGGRYAGGTNCNGGTIFRLTSSGTYTLIHEFTFSEGCNPRGSLRLRPDGSFLGVATSGGGTDLAADCCGGTIFKIQPDGTFARVFLFAGTIASGTPYGYYPNDAPVEGNDGSLYGTTNAGGPAGGAGGGVGTVYKLTPADGVYGVAWVHGFGPGNTDPGGGNPAAGLTLASDGRLYGSTANGGDGSEGTLFQITTGGAFSKLYSFTGGADGGIPMGRLLEVSPGVLVGTGYLGPNTNGGEVFQFTVPSTAIATSTALSASTTTAVFGQQITLTATVSASNLPSGSVEFFDGNVSLGTAALSGGQATLVTSGLTLGSHNFTASYPGDGNFQPSVSTSVSVNVTQAQTDLASDASPNPAFRRQAITITVNVSPRAPGAGTPTGQVAFTEGRRRLGTATLVNGQAVFQLAFNNVGDHVLTLTYQGDTNFTGSSSQVTLNVTR